MLIEQQRRQHARVSGFGYLILPRLRPYWWAVIEVSFCAWNSFNKSPFAVSDERKENMSKESNFILFTLLLSRLALKIFLVCGLDFIFISADKDNRRGPEREREEGKRNVNKKKCISDNGNVPFHCSLCRCLPLIFIPCLSLGSLFTFIYSL